MKYLCAILALIYIVLQPFMIYAFVDKVILAHKMSSLDRNQKIERCLGQRTHDGYCWCLERHGEQCWGEGYDYRENFIKYHYGEEGAE